MVQDYYEKQESPVYMKYEYVSMYMYFLNGSIYKELLIVVTSEEWGWGRVVAKGNFIFILYPSELFDYFPFSMYYF